MTTSSPPSAAPALSRSNPDHELAAVLVLIRSKWMSADRLSAMLIEFGSAVVVLHRVARESQLAPVFSGEDVERALAEVSDWRSRGLDVRLIFDPAYPQNLLSIFNSPPFLLFRGTWDEQRDRRSVAVVGTRKPSPEGLKRANSAAARLAKAGITVVSGLAAGVDAAAHASALEAGGRTVAVMGTGIDRIYPPENFELAGRILGSGGALISQFFPDQPPTHWTFPMRNVVMSGLSLATLVIEASATSGAKSQAHHALEHGRTVFLPKSLVEEHEWARRMVEAGVHGVRAVQVDSPDDIVERITGSPQESALAV